MSVPPVLVLAVPGAMGGAVAAHLATATGRATAAWDEVADVPLGRGAVLRQAVAGTLASDDRDWSCPPPQLVVPGDREAVLAGAWSRLAEDGIVLHDPGLVAVLPSIVPADATVHLVVLVAEHERTVRTLVATAGLEPGPADALVRAGHAELAALAAATGALVVEVAHDHPSRAADRVAEVLGRARSTGSAARSAARPAAAPDLEVVGHEVDPAADGLRALQRARDPDAPATVITGAQLHGQLAALPRRPELDAGAGPRAAVRRSLWWADVAGTGPRVELTSACHRLPPAGADVEVVAARDIDEIVAALDRDPGSVARLLLADVLGWCTADELAVTLRLCVAVLTDGGTVALGHAPATARRRQQLGLQDLSADRIATVATAAGLEPIGRRASAGDAAVAVTLFTARPTVLRELATLREEAPRLARRVSELESELAATSRSLTRITRQHERLLRRRSVRLVLRVAGLVAPLFRTVRARRSPRD